MKLQKIVPLNYTKVPLYYTKIVPLNYTKIVPLNFTKIFPLNFTKKVPLNSGVNHYALGVVTTHFGKATCHYIFSSTFCSILQLNNRCWQWYGSILHIFSPFFIEKYTLLWWWPQSWAEALAPLTRFHKKNSTRFCKKFH